MLGYQGIANSLGDVKIDTLHKIDNDIIDDDLMVLGEKSLYVLEEHRETFRNEMR